jgi:hypothetical protein
MKLEIIMLSERSQTQINIACFFLCIKFRSKNKDMNRGTILEARAGDPTGGEETKEGDGGMYRL